MAPSRKSNETTTTRESRAPSREREQATPAKPLFVSPQPDPEFMQRLGKRDDLAHLISNPPVLSSAATRDHDGRAQKFVLVVGREGSMPLSGAVARLYEGDDLVDETRLDLRGLGLLRFRASHGHAPRDGQATAREHAHDHGHAHETAPRAGRVELLAPGHELQRRDVSVPAGASHKVLALHFAESREVHVESTGTPRSAAPRLPPVDNLLDRLPPEFDVRLCRDLESFFAQSPLDPAAPPTLLPPPDVPGLPAAGGPDFRRQRLPIVKRFSVVRQGLPRAPPGGTRGPLPPRRYIVRLRQDWTFVGYSLGPLARVDALDPGSIVEDVTRTVDRAIQSASQAVDRALHEAQRTVDTLARRSVSVDNVVAVATSTEVQANANGWYVGIPGLIGFGEAGGGGSVSTNVTTTTRTDTSLELSNSLHAASTILNQVERTAERVQRELQNVVTTTIGRVSPLLTRATNMLRWNVIENYLVCTHVEDVLELESHAIATITTAPGTLLFTAEQIVDLQRILSPRLLEPRLRRHFATLADAVDAERGGALPIASVDVTLDYASPISFGAATVTINGASTGFELVPGGTSTTRTIRFTSPIPASAISTVGLRLSLGQSPGADVSRAAPGIQIANVRLAFRTTAGHVRETETGLGTLFSVDEDTSTRFVSRAIGVPAAATGTEADPLVVHVNANRAYYFGLVCEAALHEPSLRDDLPHFAAFRSTHPVWGLPIIGFEGNRAIVVKDADTALPEVREMLEDPGTATLVQITVPGAYAEALQGLLQLAIAEGLHPALLPPLPPAMPPLALVDITGRTIPLAPGATPATPSTPTPSGP